MINSILYTININAQNFTYPVFCSAVAAADGYRQ